MKIAMLLSGGVDSSVALALLKEQGHDITAFYLKIWLEDEMSYLGSCPWEEDLGYAQEVCEQLDVSLRVVPLQKEYHERVVSYTIEAVRAGLTPNPDIHCNAQVKFGAFMEKYGHEFDRVATGHYAQISTVDGAGDDAVHLTQAPDPIKDQTYFLSMMSRDQLSRAIFPIGHLEKSAVRALATELQLPTAKRKDSQGICFLGKISFTDFLKHHLGTLPGVFVEKETDKELGTHEGHYFYTIGQRRGVEVNGGPWYVCGKDVEKNIIYLTHGFAGEDQSRDTFSVKKVNWINKGEITNIAKVKLRHGPTFAEVKDFNQNKDVADVTLSESERSVTPGQYAVFYTKENECVGAGVIE